MVRRGNYKFNYYVGYPPELFDLTKDPEEESNLAGDEQFLSVVREMERLLRSIVNPEESDRRAKDDHTACKTGVARSSKKKAFSPKAGSS